MKKKEIKEKKFGLFGIITIVVFAFIVLILLTALIFRLFIAPPVESKVDKNIKKDKGNPAIQISILNSSNIQGLAKTAKNYLRERGFDVVQVGNFSENSKNSFIIDRIGDKSSAKKVAYAMGIPDSLIVTDIDSSLYLRNSVIIGSDYKKLKPFK